jgi:hemolysin activation/secretion protein
MTKSGITRVGTWSAATLLLVAAALPAFAQQQPPSTDPGRLQDQPSGLPLQAPRVAPRITVPDQPQQQPVPGAERINFTLRGLTVEGSTVYPAGEFAPLYANLIGQQVTLAQIFQIANQITLRYRQDGYILSRAVVPQQRIGADGMATIRVVEGFIANVNVQGARNLQVLGYGQRLQRFRPLRADQLERYLLLANDLPGVVARGVLSPSTTTEGASDLTIIVEERTFDGFIGMDNRGTRFVGPEQLFTGLGINNITGMGERTFIRFTTTPWAWSELLSFQVDETVPIGTEGTRLTITGARLGSQPGLQLRTLNVDSDATTVAVQLYHPIIRSRAQNLNVRASFWYRDLTSEFLHDPTVPPSTDDRLRILRIGATYDLADRWQGVNSFSVDFHEGLQIFNATSNNNPLQTRPGGQTNFSKLTLEASRLQSLGFLLPGLQVQVSAIAQFTLNSTLLASEQFGLGSTPFGRAYDYSEITGDSGFGGAIELQYGRAVTHEALRRYIQEYQAYVFYDGGMVWDHTSTGTTLPNLQSTGLGIRVNAVRGLSFDLQGAKALSRCVANPHTPVTSDCRPFRFFFSTVLRF